MDLEIQMKVDIQIDSSQANSLTDPERKTLTRNVLKNIEVQDGFKKVLAAKKCANVGTRPVPAFRTATTLKNVQDWFFY